MSISYKEQYEENKQKIIACLDKAIQFMDDLGYPERKKSLEKQKNNLESGEFTIVVVGEFSAGKSTFLNALMGKKMLPSFSSETTATINFLRHKNRAQFGEEGHVFFTDGKDESLVCADDDTISKYVSTRGENVAETVHHLDLYKESKFLEGNVTLVDSPGLNGVAKGHAEITKEQIQKSSASIFMFSARQPGSKTDFEVLADLSKRVSSIICVLNQIDAIKTNEDESVESVIQKLKENYKTTMGSDVSSIPEIYPISAYQALVGRDDTVLVQNGLGESVRPSPEERKKCLEKSRMPEFENRLFRYLTQGEKTKSAMTTPISQLTEILNEIIDELKEEQQVLDGKVDESDLQTQIDQLEEKKESMQNEINEKRKEIQERLKNSKEELTNRIISEAGNLKNKLLRNLENWDEPDEIDPEYIKKQLDLSLEKIAQTANEEFVENNGAIISDYSDSILENSLGAEFKFKVTGELAPLKEVSIGFEKHSEEVKSLEKEEEELRQKENDISIGMYEKMESEERRKMLEQELKAKREALEHYEEVTLSAIPSPRVYTTKEKMERIVKKRLIPWFNKREEVIVDVQKVDNSEREEFLKERDARINKKQKEIEVLEEEYRKIPVANVGALKAKQQQLEQAIEEKRKTRIESNKEFREQSAKTIEKIVKSNKRLIEDYIEQSIALMKSDFFKQYKKNESLIVTVIMDRISETLHQKIESAESRIKQIKEEMSQAESDKLAKVEKLNEDMQNAQNLYDEAFEIFSIIDSIPTDKIENSNLED